MAAGNFDELTDIYEAMIDWPRRLAHEEPFYRRWFEKAGVASVLDVACGTGHHAARFHDWGLRVEAADLSPSMIERAKETFGEAEDLRWVVRGFDRAVEAAGSFDAAVCVGNSLALAPDRETAERAVAQMLAALRPGGVAIVHVVNLWKLPDGLCVWQKCRRAKTSLGEVLILKGAHRCDRRGYVELVVMRPEGGPLVQSESVEFQGFEAAELEAMARRGGAKEVVCFGGYQEEPYQRAESTDLIVVARK